MNRKIYLLLPVHNRREITRSFVACLKAQSYHNFHLVLIDDGCRDGTAEMVREELAEVTVIRGTGDWWWAGALQQGYHWLASCNEAASGLVLIMNDDTLFEPDFLERGAALVEAHPGAVFGVYSYSSDSKELVDAGMRVNWPRLRVDRAENDRELACFSSNALFMNVTDFLASGGFRPRLLPHYLSDIEFTLRLGRQGVQLKRDSSLKLFWDQKTSGFHDFRHENLSGFFARYFSRRSSSNPWAWCAFVALACPWPWKLTGWLRVWAAAGIAFVQALVNTLAGKRSGIKGNS